MAFIRSFVVITALSWALAALRRELLHIGLSTNYVHHYYYYAVDDAL